jgi:signal transduction histidine kinase
LAGRVAALATGSHQIAAGNLEVRIPEDSGDELGALAAAFNQMAVGLDGARQKITQQTNEIVGWNQKLEKRVEEKTDELRQAQELLFRSRSLSALGELGAGVAHEINNPLTGALGIVQLLIADLPAGHPARPLLEDLEGEALRIRKIVQNMLRLAQRQSGHDTTPVDLARTLDDAVELCSPSELSAAGIVVVRKYEPTSPVRGSATQLQESFIQIIQNARNAMKPGGTLTLETRMVEDALVRVRIADTGAGISPEHLPRIFDPFFTTKGDRSGPGLGLSFVHRTVEDHGGTIKVESSVGGGTTFVLSFPADAGRAHRP